MDDEWQGWDGETIVHLSDGSYWEQSEYLYEYRYSYRPAVEVTNGLMLVEGMTRAVRVKRISVVESTIDGAWSGWDGKTELQLTNGSKWRQAEYHYEYRYAHRPSVIMFDGKMLVQGTSKPIRVSRISR
ncbi:hypothetical protein [Frigoribacterium sp. CFBP 13712]|uniref:hypothetical protein n=1 Tax=Frigoribacterium sp. CFBP 13712 TaxID=2775309 RepID=UPI0017802544|nr:hypothetical protein [Frigoribacterium sp. CFBP 13712]MBD8704671.1 hypothetical protein [Frigoribacterium sp. CFBP 13712]